MAFDPIFADTPKPFLDPDPALAMQPLYIVLWSASISDQWNVEPDGVYSDRKIAELRLQIEQATHPAWRHHIVTAMVPAAKTGGAE